jgi:hypothetical protein
MKSRLLLTLPLIGSFAFVSCFPIPNDRPKKKPDQDTTITSEEQQKIEEQRELMKQRELEKQQQLANQQTTTSGTQTQNTVVETPTQTKTSDYPFANPVPGKLGFVFSPYNNKLVDVRDIPSGTLVQDPTFPETEKKYFRVP